MRRVAPSAAPPSMEPWKSMEVLAAWGLLQAHERHAKLHGIAYPELLGHRLWELLIATADMEALVRFTRQ